MWIKLEEFAPVFCRAIATATLVHARASPVRQCPPLMESAIFNQSRYPYSLIWSQTPSARPYRSCNRIIKFVIGFIACANRSKRGSPRPEFELSFDPLGVIAPALKPFAERHDHRAGATAHVGRSHDARFSWLVTNQHSISAFECQRLMREVKQVSRNRGRGMEMAARCRSS